MLRMSAEQLKNYVRILGLHQDEISKQYIGEKGKSVSKNYISMLLNGKQAMGDEAYEKLVNAINKAQMVKNKQLDKLKIEE
tara:strand:+ start:354 stop:596 length:243 start_codon:yes stop_codon:yes gene_type:complete